MTIKTQHIRIEDYVYPLTDDRIAKYPLTHRDESKLLVYKNGHVSETIFKNIVNELPANALVVFNNTRVIQARLVFQKKTGAHIEIFCLEPFTPSDYALSFQSTKEVTWLCLVGNLKKWKGEILEQTISVKGQSLVVKAEKIASLGESHQVRFSWDAEGVTFADVLESLGELPIPPYLHRKTETSDLKNYQTVYAQIKGSVAAPTAGLHFTPEVLKEMEKKGFEKEELTLHVGAGTFKPVKSDTIEGHQMHTEYISVKRQTIEHLLSKVGNIIAVGTTTVRTLESLYYIGVLLSKNADAKPEDLVVQQWMPYAEENNTLSLQEALGFVLSYLDRLEADRLVTATRIMIAPGYTYKVVNGMITNFHQPQSTLLLLVSAFVKGNWRPIYDYALEHDFRFLSYGDSSLLL